MKFCTFKNFLLKESDYKIDSDDRIFQREISGKKIVAVNHVNVTKIYFEEFEAKDALLIVEYKSPDRTIYKDLEVRQKLGEQRIRANWEELFSKLKSDIKKKFQTNLCNLYRRYFCHCVKQYTLENPASMLECGWLNKADEKIFYPVTDTCSDEPKIPMLFLTAH